MIKTNCSACGKEFMNYPSRISVTKYRFCSKECRNPFKAENLTRYGKKYRYKKGHKVDPKLYKKLAILLKNEGHPKWKGEKVGYRGLHQWVRRNKGNPRQCSKCGRKSLNNRMIQWANFDGEYHRKLEDFIPLCVSCHKAHDLALKSNRDSLLAIQ